MSEPSLDASRGSPVNVARRLAEFAVSQPQAVAVAVPRGSSGSAYDQLTFAQLHERSEAIARGLLARGLRPGMRLVLLVPPSLDFFALVFAMLRSGLTMVLIDPGLGKRNLVRCLRECQPDGFIAIPLAQAVRCLLRWNFPQARHNVTVGKRWFWSGPTLVEVEASGRNITTPLPHTQARDPAAIIFTSGSTGVPKGVLYTHEAFDRQVTEIRDAYGIQPGEIDIPGFPLFGLFNAALGVTTVVPRMDFTRPASVDPKNILQAAADWKATQSFASPAVWNMVGRHCERTGEKLATVKRVLSAGAPVPPHVLQRMRAAMHAEGEVHTPYGATEALPVATISASEVLGETAAASAGGAGTCVGRRFPGIEWRVIAISDEAIPSIAQAAALPVGEIGELIVRGPVISREYVTRREHNALHKIADGDSVWHRLGDVGYLDSRDRFWFCGRKSHRVLTANGPLFTIPCEAIFNQHPRVYRSALVGVGERGQQSPVVLVELWPEHRLRGQNDERSLLDELLQLAAACPLTQSIRRVLVHPAFPVDIRHNAKIFREKLAVWAAMRMPD